MQLEALEQLKTTGTMTRDSNAVLIASLGYAGAYGITIASNGLHYTKESDTDPEVFGPFTNIQLQISNSLRVGSNVDSVNEFERM